MNERPDWCPHKDCLFQRGVQSCICGGLLPKPEPHDADFNHFRICIRTAGAAPFDLQVNRTDLGYFRWVFDALDGKSTSWLSKKEDG